MRPSTLIIEQFSGTSNNYLLLTDSENAGKLAMPAAARMLNAADTMMIK